MDKVQVKMVELIDNLTALEVCLSRSTDKSDAERYGALILYLQWDMPIEDNDEEYAKLKKLYQNSRNSSIADEDSCKSLQNILRDFQQSIYQNERNGNQLTRVYKDAIETADAICQRLDKHVRIRQPHSFRKVTTQFVPYSLQKAAL